MYDLYNLGIIIAHANRKYKQKLTNWLSPSLSNDRLLILVMLTLELWPNNREFILIIQIKLINMLLQYGIKLIAATIAIDTKHWYYYTLKLMLLESFTKIFI